MTDLISKWLIEKSRKLLHRVKQGLTLSPTEGLFIRLIVKNRDGSIASTRYERAHSYLKQYNQMMNCLYGSTYGTSFTVTATINDTSDTGRAWPAQDSSSSVIQNIIQEILALTAPAANANYGLVVGTGNTANSNTTYALASMIAHGNGSGQLYYNATTVGSQTNPSGQIWQFIATRTFTNNSGGTIVVAEIGMVVASPYGTSATEGYFQIARDVLSSTQSVLTTQTLTVQYVISITIV